MLHKDLTEQIIKAFFNVYNELGYGFLESIYENAMLIELRKMGLSASNQILVRVYFSGDVVGQFKADVLVENLVMLELKTSKQLREEDEAQLINYLRGTDKEVGLLLNFGQKPEFRRKLFTNDRKPNLQSL